MEAQIYLYMWDNRWVWGISHLTRPSWVWALWVCVKSFGQGNKIFEWQELVSTVLAATLFLKQRSIENIRYIPFVLDEDELKIGHYLKRKESLYTY